ncbi:MAG: hypothetical protein F6J93_24785 [Oscillatoria sp. SIO1A7]|nr:hypothetical protein [Oscillatoria sp. SIO1A7]
MGIGHWALGIGDRRPACPTGDYRGNRAIAFGCTSLAEAAYFTESPENFCPER